MNDQMNAPMSPVPSGPTSFLQVWMDAITKPNEQTYARMAASPDAKSSTAFLWVFVGSLVQFLVITLAQGAMMNSLLQQAGIENQGGGGAGVSLITALCGAPVGAVLGVLGFAIVTGIVQWVAGLFGGRGTFPQLAYALAAITAPFSLVSAVLTLLALIPYVGLCFSVVSAVAGIYVLVLQVMAVKGVNQFGWGQAAGSLLLPVFALACCIGAVVAGLISVLAPAIQDTFNQLNQSLAP